MINVYVREMDDAWFGLAYDGEEIVATSIGSSKEKTIGSLLRSLQPGVKYHAIEERSEFAERTALMLKELDSGNEDSKKYVLATRYYPERVANVLKAASIIPLGYVASYGSIAKTAGTEPRIVGRIMAANPLYPIVPCHRVVGSDFSLIGYGGRKNPRALQAKLARLSKEARGFVKERKS